MTCRFVPSFLLDRLAEADDPHLSGCGHGTRAIDDRMRAQRAQHASAVAPGGPGPESAATTSAWQVHNAHHGSTLPGDLVRRAGGPESGDAAVDEAGAGLEATLALLQDLGRSSYDGRGASVVATVHYEQNYDNAFWDGKQLVFGDGDGTVFGRFTTPVDVLGHELTHAVTQYAANLTYSGQSGALNESISDAFGSCVKQRVLGQDAHEADWLIGEGIFLPGVQGRALRSMIAPGTAYDDPRLGKDPQVATMDDYVETSDDDGGVHLNSGIPNKAFQLAATAIGGTAWEGAGKIWFAALTSGLAADTDFATFAEATITAAGDRADAVRSAWQQVGVLGDVGAQRLSVRRTGGFGGLRVEQHLDLDSDTPRSREARDLLTRVDLAALPTESGTPRPDRFLYTFSGPNGSRTVHEPDLTDDLRALARLVLEQ